MPKIRYSVAAEFFKKTDLYVKNGFMEHNGTSFSFTPKGFLVSNTILADLI